MCSRKSKDKIKSTLTGITRNNPTLDTIEYDLGLHIPAFTQQKAKKVISRCLTALSICRRSWKIQHQSLKENFRNLELTLFERIHFLEDRKWKKKKRNFKFTKEKCSCLFRKDIKKTASFTVISVATRYNTDVKPHTPKHHISRYNVHVILKLVSCIVFALFVTFYDYAPLLCHFTDTMVGCTSGP